MSDMTFRIHPAVNFARVGGSKDYYIAPETAAGRVVDPDSGLMGGLPIKCGTESTPVQEADLRDDAHRLKRQAARFKIFAYPAGDESYPNGGGVEVKIGDTVGGRKVTDIVWTVHVANKKANFYSISTPGPDGKPTELGIDAYNKDNHHPPARNKKLGDALEDPDRVRKLRIDPGPRAISSKAGGTLHFKKGVKPTWADGDGNIHIIDDYFTSFPNDHWDMFDPLEKIDTLGEIEIEEGTGRLLVLGGHGRCSAMKDKAGNPPPMKDPIDNDGWFDDTSDGPVNAVLIFGEGDDATTAEAHGAWVVTTDPSWAPQTRNVVSTWDDIFNTWVEKLGLMPELYAEGGYRPDFQPSFDEDVMPIFHGAMLQQWNTNLPVPEGVDGHRTMGKITAATDPTHVIPNLTDLIRDPGDPSEALRGKKMPLALGDAQQSFLTLTPTQFFFLKQWHAGRHTADVPKIGPGEALDRDVLENCLGGRYSPGIDLTFIVRQPDLYIGKNWKEVGCGPFRINQLKLDYRTVVADTPFLGVGYVPLRDVPEQIQPGDLSKFMSLPWHTDYNSCAVHEPDPNPPGNNTLYWSWPAQRPVNVYRAEDCVFEGEGGNGKWYTRWQVFSVRGTAGVGTHTDYPQQQGRFQCYFDFVDGWEWEKVGFVIQGLQIPADHGENYGADKFLEVSSCFEGLGDDVPPWPTATREGWEKPDGCGPKGSENFDQGTLKE
jgi:hypothetical protein